MIRIKRTYDRASKEDGFRVLVDRLWLRGISKEEVKVDLWLKDIAPSDELRKWFSHNPEKWEGLQKYEAELEGKEDLLNRIKHMEKEKETVTLLYSAKDEAHGNAVALKGILQKV